MENPVERKIGLIMTTRIVALALAVVTLACGDRTTVVNGPTGPSSTFPGVTPTPTPGPFPTPAPLTRIEFRVSGNPSSARVRYSTPADGLTQTVTGLPFSAGFSTSADTVHLSLDATPIAYSLVTFPFFGVQIIVNDSVFREATSFDFSFTTLAIDGTWRR